MQRYEEVSRVLSRVLVLNLVVALAKIALGLVSGAVSVLSDGFHSLTDGASNLVAMIGVRVARQPPDEDHPYGHRKFETLASVGILIFLVLVLVQVASAAAARLRSVEAPRVDAVAFWVMGSTFAINLAVVLYERRAGRRLSSEILLADAHHTTSDLATSLTVIAALVGVRFGYSWLDPAAALVVAGFIAYACWEIFRDTSRILGDRIVIDETSIRAVVQTVPDVLGCHRIRTRGSVDHVFLDLHVWMDGRMPLHEAHRVSHVVKDRLMARFPEIKDAVIHLEPPPGE
ncbi:MAG TPA: cation diffusion facilitator family transporter [Vicinamibacterales bacterium]|nr:cation diffusion facilitator family transporter [Vicinamibacterales bacterium]